MSAQILDIVIYRPKSGVDPQYAVRQLETVMDPLFKGLPGFGSMWRSRTSDGTFVDTFVWNDEAGFREAGKISKENPALGAVFALFEESSLTMLHARVFE